MIKLKLKKNNLYKKLKKKQKIVIIKITKI